MKSRFYSPRIVAKLLVLITIIYTIIVSLNFLISKPSLQQYHKLLYKQFTHKYNQLYYNFLASTYDLDNDKGFNKQLAIIRQDAIEDDQGTNEFWMLNKEVTEHLPLNVPIPLYFRNLEQPSTVLVHKFDPRLTFGAYYQYIARSTVPLTASKSTDSHLELPFHWSDWVDLSVVDKYIISDTSHPNTDLCSTLFDISNKPDLIKGSELRKVEDYCQYNNITNDSSYPQLGFEIFDQPGPQTIPNRELLGRAYLFQTAPSPKKLIFLTTNGSYQIDVSNPLENSFKNSLLYNGMIDSLPLDTFNVIEDYKYLQAHKRQNFQYTPTTEASDVSGSSSSRYEFSIPQSAFINDPESAINEMKQKQQQAQLSLMDQDYLNSITFSHNCHDPPKYFYEAKLLKSTPNDWQGEHYDWRFFQGITLDLPENAIVLHRLIKNYLNFARIHGITTWIAHGSLLAWYWNGIAFPWDGDIDVQVPVSELYKLGQYYNQTLVIENAVDSSGDTFDGMGRYFVDIGSSITHRVRGNGNNAIDGRFIDVDTGLYIDITGLALTDAPSPDRYDLIIPLLDKEKQAILRDAKSTDAQGGAIKKDYAVINRELQLYNCRNHHFSSYQELSPLITSTSENQIAYIPKNFMMILNDEYNLPALSRKQHRKFTFLNNLRLWYHTKPIKVNSHMTNVDSEGYDFESLQILNSLTMHDHLNLIGNDVALLQEWELTKNYTRLHQRELELIYDGKVDEAGELIELNVALAGGVESRLSEGDGEYCNLGNALRADYFMHKLLTNGER